MRKKKTNNNLNVSSASVGGNIFLNILFAALAFTCVYPMLLILGTSFASEQTLIDVGYRVLPKEISFEAYKFVSKNMGIIIRAYGVSIGTTLAGTALHVLINALYAYAISRREFVGKKFFTYFAFFTMLFSGGLVPWYLVCTRLLHIDDTYLALILPLVVSAWNIIILRTFMSTSIPDSIIESARIDGAHEFTTFFRIVWPIALPGLATIALFAMLGYWNDYYNPMILTSNPNLQNLQLYLYNVLENINMLTNTASAAYTQAGHTLADLPQESARMALCIIAVGPIILAYPFFQRYFIQGLTIGAVKG